MRSRALATPFAATGVVVLVLDFVGILPDALGGLGGFLLGIAIALWVLEKVWGRR